MQDTTVLLPTLNESATVADVIGDLREEGFSEILVMDGGSNDGTRELARKAGARVEQQSGSGKGQAVKEAMDECIDTERVVMLDADGTYDPADAPKLLAELDMGFCGHVVGDRTSNPDEGCWPFHRRVGNRLINLAFAIRHQPHADILSGYRAWTREAWEKMEIEADGWGIETELCREAIQTEGVTTVCVGVNYYPRPDGSESKLSPITAAPEILSEL
jgi:dolichol-phosphate mannosyltransferase